METQHHYKPSLHRRAAPWYLPTTTVAVGKAVRDFDEYVYEASAANAHHGYELPKKALKAGVTTVEVRMSERQASLFFPDAQQRMLLRGKANVYDKLRPICIIALAIFIAKRYFTAYYVPEVTLWGVITPYLYQLSGYAWTACFELAFFILVVIYSCYYVMWGIIKAIWPCLITVDVAAHMIDSTVRQHQWLFKAIYDQTLLGVRYARDSACNVHHNKYVCPAKPFRYHRVQALGTALMHAFWETVPLLSHSTFWEAIGVFIAVAVFGEWLTRCRTVWVVRLRIESQAFSIARNQKTRAKSESTTIKVAATPVITQVDSYVRATHTNMPVELRDQYLAICLIITAGWADNRVRVVSSTPGEPDTESAQGNSRESLGDLGAAKRLLKTRNNTAKPNVWRKSVRVIKKSITQLFDLVQRGQDRNIPGADEVKEHYSGVVTGPEFFDITEGFEGSMEDEIAGVSRHLRQPKSLVTGQYISRELSPEAEARMEMATDVIVSVISVLANKHFLSILEWSLPKKWGSTCETYYQRLVEIGRTVVSWPMLTGFVKLCELALPIDKLPRLVGSMGMLCCAKDAVAMCTIENLFKKFLPQIVVKGLTFDGVSARFSAFARRAKRLGLKLLSIDMSAMDSSVTDKDRKRVRRVLQAVVDALEGLLEADLQSDYVTQCAAKRKTIRWILKYIEVQIAADDSILFSGERGTSIYNRIIMLIVWGAILIEKFGETEGKSRIEKMLHCPGEAHKDSPDDRAVGRVEQHPVADKFPEDICYDNNIGDGDDCTLAIPHDMFASKEEFILCYEKYYKLVEPCSAWNEDTDIECLSLMKISSGSQEFFIPKVQRNAQRIIAHKIRVLPGKHFAEGRYTYTPTAKEYAEIATDLWQRSFSLKHTMVVRHLTRAMFEYCYSKCSTYSTIYDEDLHRLGKQDGDMRLSQCLAEVHDNTAHDVSAWSMIKATHFANMATLSVSEINVLKDEWYSSDLAWSLLELTDDLCAHPTVLLKSFPLGPNVAASLGFKQELIDLLKIEHQLVKGERTPPEMSAGMRTGGSKGSTPDDEPPKVVVSAGVIIHKDGTVLCGYEPQGKKRAGMLTFPMGKLEKDETRKGCAVRETCEEAALAVAEKDLVKVRDFEFVAGGVKYEGTQYSVPYSLTSPSMTIHADKLTDLKFRTASEIVLEHAPNKIAKCITEVVVRTNNGGIFFPGALGIWPPPVPGVPPPPIGKPPGLASPIARAILSASKRPAFASPSQPQGNLGHEDPHDHDDSSVSSTRTACPAVEVEAVAAEANAAGPRQLSDGMHSHNCPVCDTEYWHSHKHNPNHPHKQRIGACPNVQCSYHSKAFRHTVGVLPRAGPSGKFRQPAGISPANGDGTPGLGKSAGKGKAGKTGGQVLSQPAPSVSRIADQSNAARGVLPPGSESKGAVAASSSRIILPQVQRGRVVPPPPKRLEPTRTKPLETQNKEGVADTYGKEGPEYTLIAVDAATLRRNHALPLCDILVMHGFQTFRHPGSTWPFCKFFQAWILTADYPAALEMINTKDWVCPQRNQGYARQLGHLRLKHYQTEEDFPLYGDDDEANWLPATTTQTEQSAMTSTLEPSDPPIVDQVSRDSYLNTCTSDSVDGASRGKRARISDQQTPDAGDTAARDSGACGLAGRSNLSLSPSAGAVLE